jgi:hypothetical protein
MICAGGSRYEDESVTVWSWAGGGRVGPSCRICCSDTRERSDGHAGDQWHDLRFLRCHSAVCAGISKGCEGSESVVGKNEAVVTYDPDVIKVEDLIKAVKSARGMNPYDAKIKKK